MKESRSMVLGAARQEPRPPNGSPDKGSGRARLLPSHVYVLAARFFHRLSATARDDQDAGRAKPGRNAVEDPAEQPAGAIQLPDGAGSEHQGTEIEAEAFAPGKAEVVRFDMLDGKPAVAQKSGHLRARVTVFGECQRPSTPASERVVGLQKAMREQPAEGVVVGHGHDQQAARLQHAVNLAQEPLWTVGEVLGHVRREDGIEAGGGEGTVDGIAPDQAQVAVVGAGDAQRAGAVVDAEGAMPEALEESHPTPRAAARLEDPLAASGEHPPQRRHTGLALLDDRNVHIVVGAAGHFARPGLELVGLVEPVGELGANILLERHQLPISNFTFQISKRAAEWVFSALKSESRCAASSRSAGARRAARQDEVVEVGLLRPAPVIDQTPGRRRRHPPARVLVPAVDVRMRPDGARQGRLQPLVEGGTDASLALHAGEISLEKCLEAAHHVAHLALRVKNDAAGVGQIGRRPIEAEQVGKPGHRDPEVGCGVIPPDRVQEHAVAAANLHRPEELVGVEAGGEDDRVDRVTGAVGADHRVRGDSLDRIGDQRHIVPPQRAQPAAVVLQHALAEGRILGNHLLEQLRVVADLALHVLGEGDAHLLVGGVDGSLRMRPARIDDQGRQQAVRTRPEDQEAVPAAVVGKVFEKPLRPVADAAVIVWIRNHPRRRTLEHENLGRLFGELGHQLEGAGAGADDRHALVGQVVLVLPARRVKGRAAERRQPREFGDLRPVQLADRADQSVGDDAVLVAVRSAQAHAPLRRRRVEDRGNHLGAETNVLANAVLVGAALEVRGELLLSGVEFRPIVVGLERIAVEVVGDVDAAARVGVLVPGAADPLVLLDHDEGDAGVAQADRRQEPRHSGADDHHLKALSERGRHRVVPVDVAREVVVERQLLEHHRDVLVGHRLADDEAHHFVDRRGGGRRRQRATAVAVGADGVEGPSPHRRLVVFRKEALGLAQQRALRPDGAAQQARVARHVDDRHHQGGDAGALQRRGDEGVVLCDRQLGRARARGHGFSE